MALEVTGTALSRALHDWFAQHAATFALRCESLRVDYVLNWGGFVNHSFRVSDGQRTYHVKLSTNADDQRALERWFSVRRTLDRYRAPAILDRIDLGEARGLVFAHLPGRAPAQTPPVVEAVLANVSRLWRDQSLADRLRQDTPHTARDALLTSFDRRFREDLEGIRASPPPFVTPALVAWMDDQVEALRVAIAGTPAFDELLEAPVHGDLWLNNVLWVDDDHWWLLDWDDLRIGDPAMDVATLIGPTADDFHPLKFVDRVAPWLTPVQRARLPLLGRATLLDWVIDPLSDWIDATTAPAHVERVRAEKERVHQAALAAYRELIEPA